MKRIEYSLLVIKPDAVRLNVHDEILAKVKEAKLETIVCRRAHLTAEQVDKLYHQHREQIFFPGLRDFMISGPSQICIVKGRNAIERLNEICGHNNPELAAPGTLRKLFGSSKTANAVHSSSSRKRFDIETRLLLDVSPADLIER